MKNIFILALSLIFFSCGKQEEKDTTNDYEDLAFLDLLYRNQLKNYSIEELFPERCDRLTFVSLYSAYVERQDLSVYEKEPGKFTRDVKSCLDDLDGNGKPDSKSNISPEGVAGVLHDALTYGDQGRLLRIREYGFSNNWVMGEGDRNLTYMPQLKFILSDMLGEEVLGFNGIDIKAKSSILANEYKFNVLTLFAWLKVKYYGGLDKHEYLIFKNLKRTKLVKALLNRLNDGNQEDIIKYLRTFPADLPLDTGVDNWGSCPRWLYFFLLKAIIDGR